MLEKILSKTNSAFRTLLPARLQSVPESSRTAFLSHNSRDKALVRELAMRIAVHGGSAWVDERQMELGNDLGSGLRDAIEASSVFVYVASVNSRVATWMKKELAIANRAQSNVTIIMLKTAGANATVIPRGHRNRIFIDLNEVGLDEAARQIALAGSGLGPHSHAVYVRLAGEHLDHALLAMCEQRKKVSSVRFLRRDYSRLDLAYSVKDVDLTGLQSPRQEMPISEVFTSMRRNVEKCLGESERLCLDMVHSPVADAQEKAFRWAFMEQSVLTMIDYCDWVASYAESFSRGEVFDRQKLSEPFAGVRVDFIFEHEALRSVSGYAPDYVEGKYLLPGLPAQATAEFFPVDLGRALGFALAWRFINGAIDSLFVPSLREVTVGPH